MSNQTWNLATGEIMNQLKSNTGIKQRGASKLGILMFILIVIGSTVGGLKVVPLYVDNNLITGICAGLIESGEAANMTLTEIRQRVSDNLRINNVRDFDVNNIKLRKENGQPIIGVAYEVRIEFIANLDVVAKFDTELR